MKLTELVDTSKRLAGTSSRLEKTSCLAELLERAEPAELPLVVSYLSGRLPGGRFGVGHQSVRSLSELPRAGGEPSALDVQEVEAAFRELQEVSGAGSSGARTELLRRLFRRATEPERDFLSRLLLEDLRQGSLEGVMIDAVAKAADVPAESVRRALMLSGDLGLVAATAVTDGADGLASFRVELFRPVRSMLASTAEHVAHALETLGGGRVALEHKLDGARIQVHKKESEVRVYTRRLNEVTEACPEVVESVGRLDARELVLDGETIALKKDGRPHPFQTTMRRFGRKLDVAALRATLPLSSFFFDCLLLDGEVLIEAPYEARVKALDAAVPDVLRVPRLVTAVPDAAVRFAEEALAAGHEGVMAKAPDAPYQAGSRGKAWLKVKSAQTLDLVVLAAEWGSGRRSGWLSNLHLGAREPETGRFVMLGKTFKGMTDEILRWQTERLQRLEVKRDDWTVYVRPELVVEIAFNDLQRSPHYPGGLALRFARLKAYREDKSVEEADTIETVRAIYERQTGEKAEKPQRQLGLFDDL